MHDTCSHCNMRYMIEPAFFYGARYVSYGYSVAFGVAFFIISKVFLGLSLVTSFIVIIIGLILLMPFIARLSRNTYINMFVSYDKAKD